MNKRALRRIPLEDFMDLTVDFAFKQMFGSEKNKQITIVFLNAILQRTGREPIKEVTFAKQETGGKYKDDKYARLDVVVRTQSNELVNIEVQISNDHDMVKRTLFYWANLFTAELKKGDGYHKLIPTITINICNFTVYYQSDYYHNTFHLYEDKTLQRLSGENDVLEIHFIELNKFFKMWKDNALNKFDDILVRWLLLLSMVDGKKKKVYDDIYRELEELAMEDETLLRAFSAWEELSQSKENIITYQSRLKHILDEEGKLDDVRYLSEKKGEKKGEEKGRKGRDLEIAKKMILKGFDNEAIADLTDLSIDQIEQVRREF